MQTIQADYFTAYRIVKLTRDANGVLVVQLHTDRRPCVMTAHTHTEFCRGLLPYFAGSGEQDCNPDGCRRAVHHRS